ncbi:membrane protein containing Forkhead-associated domain protein [Candidatus Magnetobacterium bavaricum]|uniref:Membrane protein containing Forkhead-associated domain protein n=1 Tax=Candidatus Magnetobacterium bavaricum TaxID=29290 RepID=A0A0F3GV45_9BACT|nr:membrane protein containing Forkhead-associated domain protein [Candidatus Magnetobacterium bavaricum]
MREKRYKIGRARSCDIVLADDSVSRVHAELIVDSNNNIYISDFNSTNKTRLYRNNISYDINGQLLLQSDMVQFGDIKMPVKELLHAVGIEDHIVTDELASSVLEQREPIRQRVFRRPIKPEYFHITTWAGIASIIIAVGISGGRELGTASILLAITGFGALAWGAIYFLVALFRCWGIMQYVPCRTTPGKAVGFLFIPFFNLYWWFVALYGLAEDANAYLNNTNQTKYRISVGVSIAVCVLGILHGLFFFVTVIPQLILVSILINQWARFYNNVEIIKG